MNIRVAILTVSYLFLGCAGNTIAKDQPYTFNGKPVKIKKGLVELTYANKSDSAHCVRSSDLSDSYLNDSFSLSINGQAVSYTGPKVRMSEEEATPRNFAIIPPGEKFNFLVHLADNYAIETGLLTVNYSIVVLDCSLILDRYIQVPMSYDIKQVKSALKGKKNGIEEFYSGSDWIKVGFIADMTPFSFQIEEAN